ncbi:MAG: ABC transporter ATP-binding protein [Thermodesulfobacteriota bacterium]|nr:ABC transporter ATP-binding protein [Thermodesulfobacteriota bacterium]
MIELKDLSKKFKQVMAVDRLSLTVQPGEIYAFLGPNGAGKTTTIKMIAGTLQPTSGRVVIDGRDLAADPERAKGAVGFIPDRPFLYEKLTGLEFLKFMAGLYRVNSGSFLSRAEGLLEMFELGGWRYELVESYSHGMKQRLIMCAALIHQPKVLVVDEPMVGLDPRGARLVKKIFRQLRDNGVCIFLSTHTLSIVADLCDRIGIILHGRLLVEGTADELQARAGADGPLEEAFLRLTGGEGEQTLTAFLQGRAEA